MINWNRFLTATNQMTLLDIPDSNFIEIFASSIPMHAVLSQVDRIESGRFPFLLRFGNLKFAHDSQ